MFYAVMKAALFGAVMVVLCACSSKPQPIDVGDRLVLPTDHPYVIPPEGIRFSNGATVGVKP